MIDLYLGDCLDVMQDIPDASVDAIITDIPYGTTANKWDAVIPFEPMWTHIKRIIKRNRAIILFGAQPFTSALIMSNPTIFKYCLVWNKVNPAGHLNAKIMPMPLHEDICVFGYGKILYNPIMRQGKMRKIENKNAKSDCYGVQKPVSRMSDLRYPVSIIEFSNANQKSKIHPTQKPVELLEYLIETYTNEGDTVLDFTFGSGTTGVAAINTNRSFIGIEKDEHYFDIASARIQKAWDEQEMEVKHG